jgi:XTP/dITP diphosphohydrolase
MLVTSNKGKYVEYKEMMERAGLDLELKLMSYPEEQLDTIEEVAEKSMSYLKGVIKGDFLIDDSGLFIESLRGFPGVYSSYVNRTLGNGGILKLMEGIRDRNAEFKTCIAYYDGKVNLFVGRTKGAISEKMRGSNGFGFDPIFIPEGEDKTYAEMTTESKNSLSHRSKAASALLEFLKKKEI